MGIQNLQARVNCILQKHLFLSVCLLAFMCKEISVLLSRGECSKDKKIQFMCRDGFEFSGIAQCDAYLVIPFDNS